MKLKKNKFARKLFLYGLFLGLVVGLILSIIGVPQIVGNAIKTSKLNFEKKISIDEKNRVATIEVSGALNPDSKNFDKDFHLLYNSAVKELEKVMNEKGMVDCKTKQQLTDLEKSAQIKELKKENSINLIESQVILDQHYKIEYYKNLSEKSKIDETKKENVNLSGKEEVFYFACPPDCGNDDGDDDGDWWDGFIPDIDLPELPKCNCGNRRTGVCIFGVCGSGGGSIKMCIAKGQEILLANGNSVLVQDILLGDKVLSYNLENNAYEEDEIIYVKENKPDSYFRINNKLELTSGHEVYVVDKGYVEVDDLKVNKDYIFENGSPVLVTSKKHIKNDNKTTYTLTVKKNKNLFVNGILVHNELAITKPEITEVHIRFSFTF